MSGMLVEEDGAMPLPWLGAPLQGILDSHRGHALLVQGALGDGLLPLAFTLAQAWLCEAAEGTARPCGRCGSCRLVRGRAHPDLTVLLPETLRRQLEWPLPEDKTESERKPSRQIRVDDVRHLIDRLTRTSGRGRGKVALLAPAELMNVQAGNALLKTLEEPAAGTRLLLATQESDRLLPTVRSRCQAVRLASAPAAAATAWLAGQGLAAADASVLLAGCGGRPLEVASLLEAGIHAQAWAALPAAVARGQAAVLSGWGVARAVDALYKLCLDGLSASLGAAPRYFPASPALAGGDAVRLSAWSRELARVARHAEHPWNEALLVEALVKQGAMALAPPRPAAKPPARGFDTLRP